MPAPAQAQADPWAQMRVAQTGPQVITAPRETTRPRRHYRSARDYERTSPRAGRPDFAQQQPGYRNDFGGGFIEFLFTGRSAGFGPQLPRPSYTYPQHEMRPHYARPIYGGAPVIQARRDQPDIAARPRTNALDPRFLPQAVAYNGKEKPGTIVIDSKNRFLYLVEEGGMATRYGVGVGRDGFGWSGVKSITAKKEWPDWRPPEEMLKRRPDLPRHMPGGPDNPLGARALYLGDSLYRIHGSNEPHTIGRAVSSGCFRMRNEDVIDLYERVGVGTKVVVL